MELGPGDQVQVRVWRQDELGFEGRVAPDGTVAMPLAGAVPIAGLSPEGAATRVREALSTWYTDPQVTVAVVEMASLKAFVLGEVGNPAVIQLTTPVTMVEALTRAGGVLPTARTRNVLLIRAGGEAPEPFLVDLREVLHPQAGAAALWLRQGDVVVVPTRTIANAARYMASVASVLSPFVAASAIYRNALGGVLQISSAPASSTSTEE
jgi:polysaccharide export outer membrane protein